MEAGARAPIDDLGERQILGGGGEAAMNLAGEGDSGEGYREVACRRRGSSLAVLCARRPHPRGVGWGGAAPPERVVCVGGCRGRLQCPPPSPGGRVFSSVCPPRRRWCRRLGFVAVAAVGNGGVRSAEAGARGGARKGGVASASPSPPPPSAVGGGGGCPAKKRGCCPLPPLPRYPPRS